MEEMKYNYLLELTDLKPDFIGFKNSDEIVDKKPEIKKQISKLEHQNKNENPLKEENSSNGNHVDRKKRKSKSKETDNEKNQNVNKKFKNSSSKIKEPLEVVQSLELSTPMFNLTSTPKLRRSGIGRKQNIDISDPIFKLPFEYGWKRELVYRTTGDSTPNRNRNRDVYYYSPNNRKLRSLREIQEQLNLSLSEDNVLTIDSFTFLKQPIGINDSSKELIRDANTKLTKEEVFVGMPVKSKKSKTPVQEPDHELLISENNKALNKMKVVFKTTKKGSKSNKNKSSSETTNITHSTPEYVTEDWKAIQSASETSLSVPLKVEKPTLNNAVEITWNSEINGSLVGRYDAFVSLESLCYMNKALQYIFKHLKVHELLVVSRVNYTFNMIAMHHDLWENVHLKNSMIRDWNAFVNTIVKQRTVSLDTRRMLIPKDNYNDFWLRFSINIKRAVKLKTIELYRCPAHVVEDVIYSLPQLEVLNATSIKNPLLMKDVKSANDLMTLNLKYLSSAQHLTELKLKGLSGIKLTELPSFKNLTNLRTLSLTSIKSFSKDTYRALDSVTTNLEHFAIGDCECLPNGFAIFLRKLTNLKSLRFENCCGNWNLITRDIFDVIRSLEKLSILELINIDFTDTVEEELEKCSDIRSLLIIPNYISQSATTNCHLIDCLKKLSPTLTHFIWGLTYELLRVTDLFISQYRANKHAIGYQLELSDSTDQSNSIPILRVRKPKQQLKEVTSSEKSDNVDIISVPALEKLLETMMVCAKTKLVKIAFSATTRMYLSDYFNDL